MSSVVKQEPLGDLDFDAGGLDLIGRQILLETGRQVGVQELLQGEVDGNALQFRNLA